MDVDTRGFKIGDKVRDVVTGVEGTVVSFTVFMSGNAQVTIQPAAAPSVPAAFTVDVARLEIPDNGKRIGFDVTDQT